MKKLFAIVLALTLVLSLAACAGNETTTGNKTTNAQTPTTNQGVPSEPTTAETTTPTTGNEEPSQPTTGNDEPSQPTTGNDEPSEPTTDVMTYEEYAAAEMGAEVIIEAYVQAHQSWWSNKVTVYAQDPDGAYFIYELACSEEDAAKLTPGTKIRVSGVKAEWAGEVEITEATFEFVESEPWIATAFDATALLGTDDLIKHQNEFVCFKGLTIVSVSYKNDEPGSDDIYVTVSYNDKNYEFCVEYYLTNADTEVYKAFAELSAGDVVDIEGFLYWYNGVNTHITSVKKAA